MPARRQLRFDSLDAAVADARHLLVAGYDRAGKWSLGQCCHYLKFYINGPLDGYPPMSLPGRVGFWVLRNTFAPRLLAKVLAGEPVAAGMQTMPASVPPPDVEDLPAVTDFENAIERLKRIDRVSHPSAIFGELTVEQLTRLTWNHAAHHLSFLIPRDSNTQQLGA